MHFLLTFVLIFSSIFAMANDPDLDPGISGTISTSGAIGVVNVQRSFMFGVQITSVVSGTVGTPIATLQGSNDGVHYANLPIHATGDATKSGSLSTSGTIYLEEGDLSVNFVRVFYSGVAGGGSLNIQEFRKVHTALQ